MKSKRSVIASNTLTEDRAFAAALDERSYVPANDDLHELLESGLQAGMTIGVIAVYYALEG
ncbi:MAG: hypothetical protein AB9866_07610 [Syntrophobacteraceae bacterium]